MDFFSVFQTVNSLRFYFCNWWFKPYSIIFFFENQFRLNLSLTSEQINSTVLHSSFVDRCTSNEVKTIESIWIYLWSYLIRIDPAESSQHVSYRRLTQIWVNQAGHFRLISISVINSRPICATVIKKFQRLISLKNIIFSWDW